MHFNRYLDFINVMTYDFHGTWETVTGHHSPLYNGSHDTGEHVYLSTVSTQLYSPLMQSFFVSFFLVKRLSIQLFYSDFQFVLKKTHWNH